MNHKTSNGTVHSKCPILLHKTKIPNNSIYSVAALTNK